MRRHAVKASLWACLWLFCAVSSGAAAPLENRLPSRLQMNALRKLLEDWIPSNTALENKLKMPDGKLNVHALAKMLLASRGQDSKAPTTLQSVGWATGGGSAASAGSSKGSPMLGRPPRPAQDVDLTSDTMPSLPPTSGEQGRPVAGASQANRPDASAGSEPARPTPAVEPVPVTVAPPTPSPPLRPPEGSRPSTAASGPGPSGSGGSGQASVSEPSETSGPSAAPATTDGSPPTMVGSESYSSEKGPVTMATRTQTNQGNMNPLEHSEQETTLPGTTAQPSSDEVTTATHAPSSGDYDPAETASKQVDAVHLDAQVPPNIDLDPGRTSETPGMQKLTEDSSYSSSETEQEGNGLSTSGPGHDDGQQPASTLTSVSASQGDVSHTVFDGLVSPSESQEIGLEEGSAEDSVSAEQPDYHLRNTVSPPTEPTEPFDYSSLLDSVLALSGSSGETGLGDVLEVNATTTGTDLQPNSGGPSGTSAPFGETSEQAGNDLETFPEMSTTGHEEVTTASNTPDETQTTSAAPEDTTQSNFAARGTDEIDSAVHWVGGETREEDNEEKINGPFSGDGAEMSSESPPTTTAASSEARAIAGVEDSETVRPSSESTVIAVSKDSGTSTEFSPGNPVSMASEDSKSASPSPSAVLVSVASGDSETTAASSPETPAATTLEYSESAAPSSSNAHVTAISGDSGVTVALSSPVSVTAASGGTETTPASFLDVSVTAASENRETKALFPEFPTNASSKDFNETTAQPSDVYSKTSEDPGTTADSPHGLPVAATSIDSQETAAPASKPSKGMSENSGKAVESPSKAPVSSASVDSERANESPLEAFDAAVPEDSENVTPSLSGVPAVNKSRNSETMSYFPGSAVADNVKPWKSDTTTTFSSELPATTTSQDSETSTVTSSERSAISAEENSKNSSGAEQPNETAASAQELGGPSDSLPSSSSSSSASLAPRPESQEDSLMETQPSAESDIKSFLSTMTPSTQTSEEDQFGLDSVKDLQTPLRRFVINKLGDEFTNLAKLFRKPNLTNLYTEISDIVTEAFADVRTDELRSPTKRQVAGARQEQELQLLVNGVKVNVRLQGQPVFHQAGPTSVTNLKIDRHHMYVTLRLHFHKVTVPVSFSVSADLFPPYFAIHHTSGSAIVAINDLLVPVRIPYKLYFQKNRSGLGRPAVGVLMPEDFVTHGISMLGVSTTILGCRDRDFMEKEVLRFDERLKNSLELWLSKGPLSSLVVHLRYRFLTFTRRPATMSLSNGGGGGAENSNASGQR